MKKIFLIRHAKSSWTNSDLTDLERPLNERGLRDAPIMAKILSQKCDKPQLALCSPARRAISTAEIFESIWWKDLKTIVDPILYEGSTSTILDFLASIDDQIDTLVAVFHNPNITNLSNLLANANIRNVPTCGVVSLTLKTKVQKWKELQVGTCSLLGFDYPKKFKIQ